jgi:hypothetical protein
MSTKGERLATHVQQMRDNVQAFYHIWSRKKWSKSLETVLDLERFLCIFRQAVHIFNKKPEIPLPAPDLNASRKVVIDMSMFYATVELLDEKVIKKLVDGCKTPSKTNEEETTRLEKQRQEMVAHLQWIKQHFPAPKACTEGKFGEFLDDCRQTARESFPSWALVPVKKRKLCDSLDQIVTKK